jgi:hypothetical protein
VSENPLSPDLARLLTETLLPIEGVRRSTTPREEGLEDARNALAKLRERIPTHAPPSIRAELETHLDEAGRALEGGGLERAREALLRVGLAFDAHVRRHRGGP